jgi:hypothetical protein
MRYERDKRPSFTTSDGRDFWGAKRLAAYGDKGELSDSYHYGRSKAQRDRYRRLVKKAARREGKEELKEVE